jgi:8-oxo-dGTP pyrophosphatase MutT (NUDIX family)
MVSIDELREAVLAFDPGGDVRTAASREQIIRLLQQGDAATQRSNFSPGHITASGIVLSSDGREILLVHHRRLARWLQPGGHVEPEDGSTIETAEREILEETGLHSSGRETTRIVGMDVHQIPAFPGEPAHLHHDVIWLFRAAGVPGGEEESRWFALDELERLGVDQPLLRAVARARN